MNNKQLECHIETIPTPAGDIHLAFSVTNTGDQVIPLFYFRPFCDFGIKIMQGDEEMPVIQPMYDTGLQPTRISLGAGETTRIATPIHLCFDPDVGPAGSEDPTCWSIRHVPTAVVIEAQVNLGDEALLCRVGYTP